MNRLMLVLLWLGLCGAAPMGAQAVKLHPRLLLAGSLGVSATPSLVTFALTKGGIAAGSQGITIATTYTVNLASTIKLYAYFATSDALAGGGYTIPSANVFGQCTTGLPTSYTAFTQTGPFGASSSLEIYSQFLLVTLVGNRSDVLNLHIDLTTLPLLAAGTYTGTLILQMQGM